MRKLEIPPALQEEFEAVEALWKSGARTRRVDALALSWIKYEKQLTRLFSFFVYQNPKFSEAQLDSVIAAFAENRNLYPETFIFGMKELGITPIKKLMGDAHRRLWPEINRIKRYRNKILHGQITGEHIKSHTLERDVALLVEWISTLASAASAAFGYDGLRPNTFSAAKAVSQKVKKPYPFSTQAELKNWLGALKS